MASCRIKLVIQKNKTHNLNYYQIHTLGVVTIPKINIELPIFDKTTDIFLKKGSSLLEGTSYPTGGSDTHAVISAHSGLPTAKLFTDLEKLIIGDVFYIDINGETLSYEVDQIKIVAPTDTSDLFVKEGEDLITLLTCTPYMINTHRLLVRGSRVASFKETSNHLFVNKKPYIVIVCVIFLTISFILFLKKYKKR